jgi:hypothetical protein
VSRYFTIAAPRSMDKALSLRRHRGRLRPFLTNDCELLIDNVTNCASIPAFRVLDTDFDDPITTTAWVRSRNQLDGFHLRSLVVEWGFKTGIIALGASAFLTSQTILAKRVAGA